MTIRGLGVGHGVIIADESGLSRWAEPGASARYECTPAPLVFEHKS